MTGRGVNGQPRHRRQEWSAGDRALAAGRRPGAADLAEGNGDAARFRSPWLLAAHRVPPSMIRVLELDLAAAGIARVDERGRTVDIHALRRTFASHRWAREGKGPRGPERRKCRERRKNRGSAANKKSGRRDSNPRHPAWESAGMEFQVQRAKDLRRPAGSVVPIVVPLGGKAPSLEGSPDQGCGVALSNSTWKPLPPRS